MMIIASGAASSALRASSGGVERILANLEGDLETLGQVYAIRSTSLRAVVQGGKQLVAVPRYARVPAFCFAS